MNDNQVLVVYIADECTILEAQVSSIFSLLRILLKI